MNGGFDPHNMLTLQVSLNGERYGSTARVEVLTRKLLERIESLPGVVAATTSLSIPLEGGADMPFNIEGRAPAKDSPYHGDEQWRWACPDYFKALKVPLLRGRDRSESQAWSPTNPAAPAANADNKAVTRAPAK